MLDKKSNIIISSCGYNEKSDPTVPFFEIGYWVKTSFAGKGLATEITNALTRYAFSELQAARVQIRIQTDNLSSINVAKKCGYVLEATLKNVLNNVTKKPTDAYIYSRFDLDELPELSVHW